MSPPIAVVLNFRTPQRTVNCLRSLVKEGITHFVLIENSEDNGAALRAMQPELDDLRAMTSRIDVVDAGKNLGFAAGVNRALTHIQADRESDVLLINSDAHLLPGCLQALRQVLLSGGDMAAPMLVSADDKTHRPVFYYHTASAALTRRSIPGSFPYLTGACVLLSKKMVVAPLFDEDFFFYGEDVLLGVKVKALGTRWVVAEDAKTLHEGAGSARNGSLFYEYHINRGHLLLARKLATSKTTYAINLICRSIFLPARALARSIGTGTLTPLRGLYMAWSDYLTGRANPLTPPAAGQSLQHPDGQP